MKRILEGLAPGLTVAVLVALLHVVIPDRLNWLASTYGIVVYLSGLVLAWIFHRSRAFIVLGLVGWLDISVVGGRESSQLYEIISPLVVENAHRPEVSVVLGTTILALLGLLALMRDRGVGSHIGALQLFGTVGVAAAAGILATDTSRMEALAESARVAPLIQTSAMGFPRITVFAALFAAAAIAHALLRYRGPIERGLMWTALFLLAALHDAVPMEEASLFLMAAGLTMTFAIVETSYVMAYRDELTGLPGRRALRQYLDGIQGTYTVAMVDVDHFKKVNDRHGHDVGDQVLKLVASRLDRTPGGGKAYRYGGEEFALLFPGRVKEDARPHVERVRTAVEESKFTLRSWRRPRRRPDGTGRGRKRSRRARKLRVTVSIGMADTAENGTDADAVLKRADEALYRAKRNGRNRVAE